MKKRTVITVLVVGLLIVAFISGSVLAQGEVTNSSKDNSGPAPATSQEEAAPGSAVQVNGVVVSSSSDGSAPNAVNASVEESVVGSAVQNNIDVQSSAPDGSLPGPSAAPNEIGPGETAPVMSMVNATGGPNSPAWNSNIRYVGSTLKPRTNDVNYDTSGSGGCVYVSSGDSWTVWNTPLTLPNGAQIEWLRMYFYDADGSNNIGGWFTKYNLYGDLIQEWYVASVDGGYNYTDVAISPVETINYNSYSYVL
jgi:hypothetical protein